MNGDNFPENSSTVKTYILKQCSKCGAILIRYHEGLDVAMISIMPHKKIVSDYYCLNCFYSKLFQEIKNVIWEG
jgi:hypothetical protein